MSLQQFLREQAEQIRSPEVQERTTEWVDSVGRLLGQLRSWLDEADSVKILSVRDQAHRIREEGLLPYIAPGLEIELGGRVVRVVPAARHVLGPFLETGPFAGRRAQGRVDLVGEYDKYHLYRFADGSGERWSIVEEDRSKVRSLDRPAFEGTVRRLLI